MKSSFQSSTATTTSAVAFALGSMLVFSAPAHAIAPPIITVYTSVGPNGNASASITQYTTNALNFLQSGTVATSTNSARDFTLTSTAQANQVIVTSFSSWRGYAGASISTSPYGSNYQNEAGSALFYPVTITNSTGLTTDRFSLSQLSFSANDLHFGNDFTVAAGAFHLSSGAFRVFQNGIDVTSTATDTTLVDKIIYRGAADAFDADGLTAENSHNQAELNDAIVALNNLDGSNLPPSLQGSYSLAGFSGSSLAIQVLGSAAVPEPSALVASIAGGLGLLIALRKKFSRQV